MRLLIVIWIFALLAYAADSASVKNDTVYVITESGIPWNRENFDSDILIRHETFDPALMVAYSYSVSFVGGSFGSFAEQSYMAHFAYEFSPEWHLYANVGLWMPLYSNMHSIAKEDAMRGNVKVIVPDITLEYKPNENMSFKVMLVNENDAFKAYGLRGIGYCSPWRNSIFCR